MACECVCNNMPRKYTVEWIGHPNGMYKGFDDSKEYRCVAVVEAYSIDEAIKSLSWRLGWSGSFYTDKEVRPWREGDVDLVEEVK